MRLEVDRDVAEVSCEDDIQVIDVSGCGPIFQASIEESNLDAPAEASAKRRCNSSPMRLRCAEAALRAAVAESCLTEGDSH